MYTPLHEVNNVEMAQFLVSNGADAQAKNNKGRTPLESAKREKNTEIIAYLESIGAKSGSVAS